ncbi:MAG: carbohydrate-binding domain-containing protein [Acetobacteraceae bacterium]|nr:carbohydrate-binding domain-containing protein [Acetobacteraceae bacterium]
MTLLGVYGENDPKQITDFENWLGRKVDAITAFIGEQSWYDFTASAQWEADSVWSQLDRQVYWTVPLIVQGTTLEQAATGAFNDYYRTVAEALAGHRPQDSTIYVRVGWELNGPWSTWYAGGHEDAYIGAFRQFVDTFRSVDSRFKFDWNISGANYMDPSKAYPGDNYVDVISEDFYWDINAGDSRDPNTAWDWAVNRPYGLQWIESFAASHGKPTAYPEWGVMTDNAGPYLQNVKAWFDSHNPVYQGYWNSDAAYPGKLSDGSEPNAGTVFKQLFSDPSSSSEGETPAPAPQAPSPAPASPASQEIGSGSDSLVLKISEDAWQGDAQYIVKVDGQQVGGTLTASALHSSGQSDTITVHGDWAAGQHKVTVQMLNDAWGGTPDTDRNLYVDGISHAGQAVSGGTAALMNNWPVDFAFSVAGSSPAPSAAPAASGPVDWNALAAQVMANHAASGEWWI